MVQSLITAIVRRPRHKVVFEAVSQLVLEAHIQVFLQKRQTSRITSI